MDPLEHPPQPTVLIVDDERDVTEIMDAVLQARGYRVLCANAPLEVRALLADDPRPINLLLVDVIMPQMPGRDLAASVNERWPDCRVIFMTAYTTESLPEPGFPAGAQILLKPVVIQELIDAVRTVLGPEGRSR